MIPIGPAMAHFFRRWATIAADEEVATSQRVSLNRGCRMVDRPTVNNPETARQGLLPNRPQLTQNGRQHFHNSRAPRLSRNLRCSQGQFSFDPLAPECYLIA